jgi:hypothetical protein
MIGNLEGAFRNVDVAAVTEHTTNEPLAATAFRVEFPPGTEDYQEADR